MSPVRLLRIGIRLWIAVALMGLFLASRARCQEVPERSATITVIVPEDAEIYFNGAPTQERGRERIFITPPLESGRNLHYQLKAIWTQEGRPVEKNRKVAVAPGAQVRVDFLAPPSPPMPGEAGPTPAEARQIALEAYIYGYSLITTEITRVQMSNVPRITGLRAPMGQFINVPRYPPADYRGVSAPNADTLYSLAWVDLEQPIVFSHPDMGQRFYLFEMVDLWMNIIDSPGTRTAGGKGMNYLLVGPGWNGSVPDGMKPIRFPTRYMAILGRIYADGTEKDYEIVNRLQSKLGLTPLGAWGKDYTPVAPPVNASPGFSMTDKPQQVINGMDNWTYFNLLARLMGGPAPPAPADAPILARMARIGLAPGKTFDMALLDDAARAAIKNLNAAAMQTIEANKKTMGSVQDGWVISKGLGRYGTDYIKRAVVAAFGWPANLEKDAVYPYTEVDSEGKTLSGANEYTMTFPKGQTPPVNGFWSITMYEIDGGWWFVPNPLNKFTVSPRNHLKYNADGSLTLYFQNRSPGKEKEANWLPAPKGNFILMMRMYWPKENDPSILNGTWKVPPVLRRDVAASTARDR